MDNNARFLPVDYESIRARYDEMWQQSYSSLVRGQVDPDPVPVAMSKRWGISAIFRIPEVMSERFEAIVSDLRQWTGDTHVLYDSSNLHTTIFAFECYRENVLKDDKAVLQYTNILRELARDYTSIDIVYEGLSANRTGIIVQGYPLTTHLQDLRHALQDRLCASKLLSGPDAEHLRQGAHVSLVVFGGNIQAATPLTSYLATNRDTDYGTATIQRIQLVRYQRMPYAITILPFATIDLGGR